MSAPSGCVAGIALASLPCLMLLAGCSSPAPASQERIRPVKTIVVGLDEGLRMRSFPGRIEATRRAELAFQVPGLLVEFPVKEGERIAKGDLIGQLRKDEFEARLTTLQGRLDQARAALQAQRQGERPEEQRRREAQLRASEARLANAALDYERSTRLLASRAISKQSFDAAEAAYRVAQEEHRAAVELLEKGTIGRQEDIAAHEAQVRALEGQVVEANIQLQDTTLVAPYDGVVAQRFVEEQQNVQAQEPVVRFQDIDQVEIEVDVPEAVMLSDIRTADIVQLVAQLSGAPGIEFPVEIREISKVADSATRTFRVRVAMQAPPELQVLPGMTATVTATYRRAGILGERVFVPTSAVFQSDSGESIVWEIGAEGVVARRPVKLGDVMGGQIEIVDGLRPGVRIAVAGVAMLREGMQVRDLADALGGP